MPVCGSCGSKDAQPFNLSREGKIIATSYTCGKCLMDVMSEVQELDRQYHELVAAGVSDQDAVRLLYARAARENEQHVS